MLSEKVFSALVGRSGRDDVSNLFLDVNARDIHDHLPNFGI